MPSLGEAERELAEAMRDATEVLSQLDVAGSGPVAEAALSAYRARAERGREVLAPGYPPRAVRVLELAQRVGLLVALAYEHGHGGAVSASEMAARGAALRPVERVARRAQVAAYNAYRGGEGAGACGRRGRERGARESASPPRPCRSRPLAPAAQGAGRGPAPGVRAYQRTTSALRP